MNEKTAAEMETNRTRIYDGFLRRAIGKERPTNARQWAGRHGLQEYTGTSRSAWLTDLGHWLDHRTVFTTRGARRPLFLLTQPYPVYPYTLDADKLDADLRPYGWGVLGQVYDGWYGRGSQAWLLAELVPTCYRRSWVGGSLGYGLARPVPLELT